MSQPGVFDIFCLLREVILRTLYFIMTVQNIQIFATEQSSTYRREMFFSLHLTVYALGCTLIRLIDLGTLCIPVEFREMCSLSFGRLLPGYSI